MARWTGAAGWVGLGTVALLVLGAVGYWFRPQRPNHSVYAPLRNSKSPKSSGEEASPANQKTRQPGSSVVESGAGDGLDIHQRAAEARPRSLGDTDRMRLWWESVPSRIRQVSLTATASNIRREEYVGPEACKGCHTKNYELWSHHSHRFMNALANESTVLGDFSGQAGIAYLGGVGTFYRDASAYRMKLVRGSVEWVYDVHQTIGSRFFQYYVGTLLSGPAADNHPFRTEDHVLPFGYWLDRKEWVPIVHVGPELPDGERADPFDLPTAYELETDRMASSAFTTYASGCNMCHTTFPLADAFARKADKEGAHAPARLHWSLADYLRESHTNLWPPTARHPADVGTEEIGFLMQQLLGHEAKDHAVTLGVSCEACHLGSKAHAESADPASYKPEFFPKDKHLWVEQIDRPIETGRTHENLNWACGRCHTGPRPEYAAGMSTWNSVECADAMKGSCYSQLRCVDCHEPHTATGPTWSSTPQQDDARCLKCHDKFEQPEARRQHTHHAPDSAHCMDCHMPRLNEGLQDMVRTHMIFSPTEPKMIESNQPNACNTCHTDRTIDWTLTHLRDWYGASYAEEKIAAAYTERDRPAAVGWLKASDPAVRLVAVDSLTRAKDQTALPQVIAALDDPFLVNRQFTRIGIEKMLGVRLEDYGYRFYMSPEERREPVERVRRALLADQPPTPSRPQDQ